MARLYDVFYKQNSDMCQLILHICCFLFALKLWRLFQFFKACFPVLDWQRLSYGAND